MSKMLFENVDAVFTHIDELSKKRNAQPVYYRGQHHNWSVTSSINRIHDDSVRKEEAKKTIGFINWLHRVGIIVPERDYQSDNLDSWAIAQHYGYKTDLIDFTTDYRIARAFALIGKQKDENGCIVCIWEDDISLLHNLSMSFLQKDRGEIPKPLLANDTGPFFHFELPSISRIANQHGVFLWDLNGVFTGLFAGAIDRFYPGWKEEHVFSFKQTDLEADIETVRRIYPCPNAAEVTIEHYLQIQNLDFFYRNPLPVDQTIPEIQGDLSDKFAENDWSAIDHIFVENKLINVPNDSQIVNRHVISHKELELLMTDLAECKAFGKKWRESLRRSEYVLFVSEDNDTIKLEAEIINEIMAALSRFEKLPDDIAGIIIFQALRLVNTLLGTVKDINGPALFLALDELSKYEYNMNDCNANLDRILDRLRECVELRSLVLNAWNHEAVFIRLEQQDNHAVCIIPRYVVNDCTDLYKQKHLEVLRSLYSKGLLPEVQISENKRGGIERISLDASDIKWELMLSVVHNPRVLFDQKAFVQYWAYFIMPWQFVMNPKRSRIYSPADIDRVCRLDADSWNKALDLYYWGGAIVGTGI